MRPLGARIRLVVGAARAKTSFSHQVGDVIVALADDLAEARALLERYRAFDENGDGRQLRVDTDAFLERTK